MQSHGPLLQHTFQPEAMGQPSGIAQLWKNDRGVVETGTNKRGNLTSISVLLYQNKVHTVKAWVTHHLSVYIACGF